MTGEKKAQWPGWETTRLIGRGSFGAVYEIERRLFEDEETEKAALKVITIPQNDSDIEELYNDGYDEESVTSTFKTHLKSIVSEYSLMRKMNGSSNVVNCDDVRYVQHDDGIGWDIYIKMELLTPLTKALPATVSEEQVIRIAKDMCEALELCSKHNIIHRDIKPQNIFVSENGDYKLGDFGIAKTVEKTMGGTKTGTYKYMAPEVYSNKPYNSTADIYSLGLVLYWMLNERRMPFMPLPPEKLKAGMDEESRSRRFLGEKIPVPKNGSKELKRIVLKACAFDSKERYQSAREMREDLVRLSGIAAPIENDRDFVYATQPEADDVEATVGTSFGHAPQNRQFDATEKTVGPVFGTKVNKDSFKEEKTVGPVFASKMNVGSAEADPVKERARKGGNWKVIIAFLLSLAVIAGAVIVGYGNWIQRHDLTETPLPVATSLYNTEPEKENNIDLDLARYRLNAGIVSTGGPNVVLLRNDGTVVAAGRNDAGQCNVDSWTDIIAISSSCFHTVGLKFDGTVVATGRNSNYQCEVNTWTDIIQIAAGGNHTVGLKSDGTVVAAGNTDGSQWDLGQCDVSDWTDIVYIAASDYYTIGVKSDGTIVETGISDACGGKEGWNNIVSVTCDSYRVVGLKADGTVVSFKRALYSDCDYSSWTDIVAIAAGYYHTVALRADGTVVAAGITSENAKDHGCTYYGQCDVEDWSDIIAIAAGINTTVGVRKDGTVLVIGEHADNMDGKVCYLQTTPEKGNKKFAEKVIATTAHTLLLHSDGSVKVLYGSGDGKWDSFMWDIEQYDGLVTVAGVSNHALGLKKDGTIIAVGSNDSGECNVTTWTNITSVAVGRWMNYSNELLAVYGHSVALKSDGTVVATGDNTYGQCNVGDWTNIKQIIAGEGFTLGLNTEGRVLFAGNVTQYAASNFAAEIAGWKGIKKLYLRGESHVVGLTEDGRVFEAGFHFGEGCRVSEWKDIVDVASGSGFTVGLKSDGTVVATGDNEWGQCNVSEWTDIVDVEAGMCCTVGLKSDGTIVVTGLDTNEDFINSVNMNKNIQQVAVGNYLIAVLTDDGEYLSWKQQ